MAGWVGLLDTARSRRWPTPLPGPVSMGREQRAVCDGGRLARSAQHHRGDGPTSSIGHVSMAAEQRAVFSGGLIVEEGEVG